MACPLFMLKARILEDAAPYFYYDFFRLVKKTLAIPTIVVPKTMHPAVSKPLKIRSVATAISMSVMMNAIHWAHAKRLFVLFSILFSNSMS